MDRLMPSPYHSVHRPHRRLHVIGLMTMVLASLMPVEGRATDVSPAALTFHAVVDGSSPTAQTVTVAKTNKRTLKWTSSDDATWLQVSPPSGTILTSTTLSVTVNAAGLAAGSYSATVLMNMEKGGNASIPVTLTVDPAIVDPPTNPPPKPVTLTWDPNAETDLAGYKVYMGTSSGHYGTGVSVGNVTSYTLSNLLVGQTYFFVVTAYDQNGNESLSSNEVSTSLY